MIADKLKTLALAVKDPQIRYIKLANRGFYNHLSDEEYIRRMFRARMGYDLDLGSPKTFNEKLQWLKIHDHNPLYTTLVDKYAVKEYVGNVIGTEHIIPTLGVWDRFEDIDFNSLPDRFVLKCTHDSGGLVIVRDKKRLDRDAARKKISRSLKKEYFNTGREWPYKHVRPRVIAEKYITDRSYENEAAAPDGVQELSDYKFYCFNGHVDCVMVCFDRASGDTKFYFFDHDWKLKRINKRGLAAPPDFSLPKPSGLEKMFEIASALSAGFPFVRVDLYQSSDKVFFGETTFYPQDGWDPNYLPETDKYFGDLIDLSLAYGVRTGEDKGL